MNKHLSSTAAALILFLGLSSLAYSGGIQAADPGQRHLYNKEYGKAQAHYDSLLQIEPNSPYISTYHAAVLVASGRPEDAISHAGRALRLDPISTRTPYLNILGMSYFHAGDYQKALRSFQRNIERGGPFGAHIQAYLTATYALLGKSHLAKENLETLEMYRDGFDWKAWIRRWQKDPQEAERLLAPIRKIQKQSS